MIESSNFILHHLVPLNVRCIFHLVDEVDVCITREVFESNCVVLCCLCICTFMYKCWSFYHVV